MSPNIEARDHAAKWWAKLNRIVVPFVFFGLIALPIAWFGRASFVPAPLHENRVLEPFPALSIHSLQKIERWFSDRFGMRDALVYYGSRLQMARTGTPTNQDVVVGPNQWLFYDQYYVPGQSHFADLQGRAPLSASQLKAITDNLRQAHDALAVCKIPFYFIVAPDKQTIYPEQLGIHIPAGAVTGLDQLLAHLAVALPSLNVIDLRPALRQAKVEAPFEIYKRTDTHWNSLGAFYGYREIAHRFTHDGVLPGAPWANIDQWTVSQAPFDQGDIAISLLSLPGYFKDYNTHFEKRSPRLAQFLSVPPDAPASDSTFSMNPAGHGRLLLYRDSFSGELMPYLVEDFRYISAHRGRDIDGEEVRRRQPTVVALQIVERNIRMLRDSVPVNMPAACGTP